MTTEVRLGRGAWFYRRPGGVLGLASLACSARASIGLGARDAAVAFSRMTGAFAVVRSHHGAIMATGGGILVAMGAHVWTGEIVALNIEAQRFLDPHRSGPVHWGLMRWTSLADAVRYCAQPQHLRRTRSIALVVGLVLTAVNQLDVIAAGDATIATWLKSGTNFVVPFIVSNLGLLGGRPRERR